MDVYYKDGNVPPTPLHHDYVEINGIKQATMNLGATAVTDYGKYYAWGETQGYTADQIPTEHMFNWDYYKFGRLQEQEDDGMTKYNVIDGKTILEPIDDAVTVEWGGKWRMPTSEEYYQLLDPEVVSRQYVTNYKESGINGILFTDVYENQLFFPYTGYFEEDGIVENDSTYLLTKEKPYDYNTTAYSFILNRNIKYIDISEIDRCFGISIRGILDEQNKLL